MREVTKEGVEIGLICQEDAAIMVPKEPTAGRLYMNPKDHKTPDPVTNLPPVREVVSGSGSNTLSGPGYNRSQQYRPEQQQGTGRRA